MRRSMLIPVVMTAIFVAALPRMAAADSLTGVLVDSTCYATMGKKATSGDHAKCAIVCAQRGGRLALVTATGDVYMVTGVFTQDNNAKLIPLLNQTVVLTGTVATQVLASAVAPLPKSDGRRPIGGPDLVTTSPVKGGDFRQGDIPDVTEMTIEVISVAVATIGIQ